MSDFEARLRDTLAERGGAAPDAIGLAHGARRRLRRRRTTWAVAAAAVVAAAVPLGLSQLAPSPDGGGRVADAPTATSGLPPGVVETGYRAESWHDLTFEVPVEWDYGGLTNWCLRGETPADSTLVVMRPDTMVERIACSPANGYGATIGTDVLLDPIHGSGAVWQYDAQGVDTPMYPDGAWVGYWYADSAVVTVVTPEESLTRRVVDSVRRIEGVDANGCPVTLGEAETLSGSTSDSLSICRYDEADRLTASRRFVGADAQAAEETILLSPAQRTDYDCPMPGPLIRTAILRGGGYLATVVTDASCEGRNGVFLDGPVHVVDDAVRELVDLTRLP